MVRSYDSASLPLKPLQDIDGVDAQFLNVVAPFHDKQRGPLQFGNQPADGEEVIGLQLEEADRILLKGYPHPPSV